MLHLNLKWTKEREAESEAANRQYPDPSAPQAKHGGPSLAKTTLLCLRGVTPPVIHPLMSCQTLAIHQLYPFMLLIRQAKGKVLDGHFV